MVRSQPTEKTTLTERRERLFLEIGAELKRVGSVDTVLLEVTPELQAVFFSDGAMCSVDARCALDALHLLAPEAGDGGVRAVLRDCR